MVTSSAYLDALTRIVPQYGYRCRVVLCRTPESWVVAFESAVEQRITEFEPLELSGLLWSLADAGHVTENTSLIVKMHMHAAVCFLEYDAIEMTKILLALERLGWRANQPWQALWINQMLQKLEGASATEGLYVMQAVVGLQLGLPGTAAKVSKGLTAPRVICSHIQPTHLL